MAANAIPSVDEPQADSDNINVLKQLKAAVQALAGQTGNGGYGTQVHVRTNANEQAPPISKDGDLWIDVSVVPKVIYVAFQGQWT